MKIDVDRGHLDDIEDAYVSLRDALDGESTDDLIHASQQMVEEIKILLEMAEDTSSWERKLNSSDEEEEDEEQQEEKDEEEEA